MHYENGQNMGANRGLAYVGGRVASLFYPGPLPFLNERVRMRPGTLDLLAGLKN
jgi:hypothetical protein